tara:strand:- start:5509 stop:6237 length:729 start_codon:yes stop_codon:yes gene_type:complete
MSEAELIMGDCLSEMHKIPPASIDMILADPPYGTTACKWDSVLPLDEMWSHLKRIIKPNGAIVMTACQPFTTSLIASNIKQFKYAWVWNKLKGANFQLCKKMPLKITEDILVFYKKLPTYNPQGLRRLEKPIVQSNKGKAGRLGHLSSEKKRSHYVQEFTNYPKNLLEFKLDRGLHPTQKPVALMEYLIKTYTNEGETVLDFTMGSGSTGVAARQQGRRFIGIEQNEDYFEIAKSRLAGWLL